jgi:hypothetical protein
LNDKHELVYGEIVTTYNPGSEIARKVEEAHQIGEEKKEEPKPQTDSTDVPRPIDIVYPGVIRSVSVNADGKIEVIDEDGTISTHEPKKDPITQEVQETVIADSAGNTYAVDQEGKVTKTSGGANQNGNVATKAPEALDLDILNKVLMELLVEYSTEVKTKIR